MNKYPNIIDSGTGEEIIFLGTYMKDGIEHLDVENTVAPNAGPPMHVHHLQDECMTIVEGILAAQVMGEKPRLYYPGDTALFRKGVAHKFWNAGEKPLKCRGYIAPVYSIEYFLTEIFASMKRSGSGRPGIFDAAYLLNRYKTEYDMLDIPVFVKKNVFPLVLQVGKLSGQYKKYRNAPEAYVHEH